MAETIGLLILEAAGATEIAGIAGLGTIAGTTVAGVSLATVVGTAAIIGASIGLSYALKPDLPKPEDGSQAVKQAIPPRIRGYGQNRLAGYYMLFEASNGGSYDVMAFHSGRIGSITGRYLHDDPVNVDGGGNVLASYGDGRYAGRVIIDTRLGTESQPASSVLAANPNINGLWNSEFTGKGIAYAVLACAGVSDPADYTKIYPHSLPLLSVIAQCSPVWDPRDPAQLRDDEATWQVSYNPVIQMIDYLTRVDGGMGRDYDVAIAPNLGDWLSEADLCDEDVATADGTEPRYQSDGWFQFDNKPEDVIGGILSTCDGWMAESGDGALSIVVGVYRTPSDPPLTEKHIFGFSLNYGQADEQTVNQLNISFTDPSANFVSVQTEPWRDEDAISLTGEVRAQALDLKWVQSNPQARRLAGRAMQRLNPQMDGSFTTSLYGLRYLGKRWVPLQYPFVSGLQDCVVEIQNAAIDLIAGRITWNFIRVNTGAIEAYTPADEGEAPVVPPPVTGVSLLREDSSQFLREDGTSIYVRETV